MRWVGHESGGLYLRGLCPEGLHQGGRFAVRGGAHQQYCQAQNPLCPVRCGRRNDYRLRDALLHPWPRRDVRNPEKEDNQTLICSYGEQSTLTRSKRRSGIGSDPPDATHREKCARLRWETVIAEFDAGDTGRLGEGGLVSRRASPSSKSTPLCKRRRSIPCSFAKSLGRRDVVLDQG